LDTRDRKLNTKTGYYFNYKLLEYFSSRNNNKFLKNHIDYRYFYNIYKEHTLGVHAIFDNNFGEIPFQKMVSLGNAYNMRGFLEGRYIDKNKAAVQMEYRFPVFKWFSGVIFTGFGEVYDKTFKLDELKNSYGAGLRFNYDKEKGITIRFDMAFNGEDSRVYVNFREAF
jgi:outer membrane translocation and assembly module TamA